MRGGRGGWDFDETLGVGFSRKEIIYCYSSFMGFRYYLDFFFSLSLTALIRRESPLVNLLTKLS